MPKLFIRLLSPATATEEGFDVQSAWIITNEQDELRAEGETDFRGLSDLIDPDADWLNQPGNVVVSIPGDHVLALSCEVPGRSTGQIRRALPFVVEEFVSTEIERMHLASGEIHRGQPVRCNLIERRLLDDWLACLGELHIHPGFLINETELLPVAEGQATVLFDGSVALVRTPSQSATVDRANLALALASLPEKRVLLINGDLDPMERAQLAAEATIEQLPTSGVAASSTLGFLAMQADARRSAINLLQGTYRPRQRQNTHWARWRVGAALAACWLVVSLVMNVVEAVFASRQADKLEAESVALYRDIYPHAKQVANPRRQMQSALAERGASGGIGLMGNLENLAASVPPDSSIQSLNYTVERGDLQLDLFIPGYEELDRVKEQLGSRGLAVEITSAEQQQDGVRARVRVRESESGA
jgi:general secretion pathway protein L